MSNIIKSTDLKNAYVEVLEVLSYLPLNNINKIPENFIHMLENNKASNYKFKLDRSNKFDIQISEISKSILAYIYKEYWATDFEKKVIEAKQKSNRRELEKNKSKNYSSEIKFKK